MAGKRLFSAVSVSLAVFGVACAGVTQAPHATPSVPSVSLLPVAQGDAEAAAEAAEADDAEDDRCPSEMALVVDAAGHESCVDKWEESLVEIAADGAEKPHAHWLPVDGFTVRAVSQPGVYPQGYISEVQADDACRASSKHLCSYSEWKTACMGPSKTTFPYGNDRRPGVCHDLGKSAVGAVFGQKALASVAPAPRAAPAAKGKKGKKAAANKKIAKVGKARKSIRPQEASDSVWTKLNDPALGQVDGTLAKTGDHGACVNDWGVYDMVGNLHEWVKTDDKLAHGTFAGGYYLDTSINGDGCNYKTTAHAHDYHDYSTGFRCCAEPQDPKKK